MKGGYSLILFLFLGFSSAITVQSSVSGTSNYILFDSFGFLSGGSIQFYLQVYEPVPVSVMFCTDTQFNNVFLGLNDPCIIGEVAPGYCAFFASTVNQTINAQFAVPFDAFLNMVFVTCSQSSYTGYTQYTFLNPGNEQLSSGDIPNPKLYIVVTIIWLVLTTLWCFNWIKNRKQKSWLHRVISLYPITKVLETLVFAIYWGLLSQYGTINLATIIFYYLFYVLFRVIFYLVLLFIASGWGICFDNLGLKKVGIFTTVVLLAGSLLLYVFVSTFFLILTIFMYVVVTILIFIYINKNLYELSQSMNANPNSTPSQSTDMNSERPNTSSLRRSTDSHKFKMFQIFRVIMISYVLLMIGLNLLELFVLTETEWIGFLLLELLELSFFICIGYTFRLRNENIYYRLYDDPSAPPEYEISQQTHNSAPPSYENQTNTLDSNPPPYEQKNSQQPTNPSQD